MKGGLTSVAIFGKFTFVGWFLSKLPFKSKTHRAQQNTRAESPGQQYTHKCLDASNYVFQMTFYANSWFWDGPDHAEFPFIIFSTKK